MCLLTNPRPTATPPLKPFVAGSPFEYVCADILGMGLSASGMKYILVMVDHFTKWLGAYCKDAAPGGLIGEAFPDLKAPETAP